MKISKLIISLLNSNQCVALRKVGTFHIVMKDPIIDQKNNTISPPQKGIDLLPLKDDDPELVVTALNEGLITEDKATDLRIFLGIKALEFSRHGDVMIDGVGRISSVSGKVKFEPSDSLVDQLIQPLPNIELPKLKADQGPSKNNEPLLPDEQGETNLVQTNDVISKLENPIENDHTIIQKQDEDTLVVTPDDAIENSNVRKSSVGIRLNQKKSSFYQDYGLPLILFVVGILLIAFVFKTCFNNTQEIPKKGEVPLGFDRAPDDVDPLSLNEERIFNNPLLNKYKDILTQEIIDSGCQIVLGTFDDQANAENLAIKLGEEGYDISLLNFEERTRVILTFDCSQHDLNDYYMEVRRTISPKAWYLIPEYEPVI